MYKNPLSDRIVDRPAPRISVVLPVYNGEKHLSEAMASILAQSFTDFELIVIDDGSTDGSLQILQEYQKIDARIRLVSRENRNLATTLNESIDMARGVWVARMDQDDIALPQRFERQLLWLEKTKADITGSWVKYFGSWDRRTWRGYQTDVAIKMDMLFKSPFVHPSVMMRAALLKQLKYDKASEKAEDYDLWVRAAQSGWVMTNVPEVLLLYRQHASQISSKSSFRQQSICMGVQKRYWAYMAKMMELSEKDSQEVLNLISSNAKSDMNVVDATLEKLLRRNQGEAKTAIMDNLTRFYLRMSADYPDVAARWSRLNQHFDSSSSLWIRFKMWIVHVLRIRYGHSFFNRIAKMYAFLIRR